MKKNNIRNFCTVQHSSSSPKLFFLQKFNQYSLISLDLYKLSWFSHLFLFVLNSYINAHCAQLTSNVWILLYINFSDIQWLKKLLTKLGILLLFARIYSYHIINWKNLTKLQFLISESYASCAFLSVRQECKCVPYFWCFIRSCQFCEHT